MRSCPFRVADGIIAAVCAAVAALILILTRTGAPSGSLVAIEVVGKSVVTYPLSADQTLTVTGRDGYVLTVTVEGGRVRVQNSTCPDRRCEQSGWLSRGGQSAVCVPAGISVRIIGSKTTLDGVTA